MKFDNVLTKEERKRLDETRRLAEASGANRLHLFAERLNEAYKCFGRFESKKALAAYSDIAPEVLSKYFSLTADKGLPKAENLIALADALDCTVDWLSGREYKGIKSSLHLTLDENNIYEVPQGSIVNINGMARCGKTEILMGMYSQALKRGIKTGLYLSRTSKDEWFEMLTRHKIYSQPDMRRNFISDAPMFSKEIQDSVNGENLKLLKAMICTDIAERSLDYDVLFIEGLPLAGSMSTIMFKIFDIYNIGKRPICRTIFFESHRLQENACDFGNFAKNIFYINTKNSDAGFTSTLRVGNSEEIYTSTTGFGTSSEDLIRGYK